jgi:hypothetical protein
MSFADSASIAAWLGAWEIDPAEQYSTNKTTIPLLRINLLSQYARGLKDNDPSGA